MGREAIELIKEQLNIIEALAKASDRHDEMFKKMSETMINMVEQNEKIFKSLAGAIDNLNNEVLRLRFKNYIK